MTRILSADSYAAGSRVTDEVANGPTVNEQTRVRVRTNHGKVAVFCLYSDQSIAVAMEDTAQSIYLNPDDTNELLKQMQGAWA